MTSLVFLVPILVGVTASPLHQHQTTLPDNRLSKQNEGALYLPSETLTTNDGNEDSENKPKREYFGRDDGATKDSGGTAMLSTLLNRYQRNEGKSLDEENEKFEEDKSKGKLSKKGRKHKAIFVDYPSFIPRLRQSYSSLPSYDIGYNDIYDPNVEERRRTTVGGSEENYQEESNIFYIRLPPTPYMFVPGLGYISQPPTYSTASLRPQIPHSRPPRPQPLAPQQQQQQTWSYHQRPNPFIKLPIDFVSNGKPTSVYHWQKKKPMNPGKLPVVVDSPITNLDDLTPGFVSNGKPTTIYQWNTNLKPAKRPDDNVNNLDKGPYLFNGKPTSLYLLKPDGSTSDHRSIQYSNFENDNSYY